MGTLSHLMEQVMELPAEELRPGKPLEQRPNEMELLKPIAPEVKAVKRGVFATGSDTREIHIRVNGAAKSHDIIVKKVDGKVMVTMDGAILHLETIEEVYEYVTELCSGASR